MVLLDYVKIALRKSDITFDEGEIVPLIEACKAELRRVGITKAESDPLIRQAVILYCKAHFGYDDKAERFEKAFEHLKKSLALSGEYIGGDDNAG